jgi:hypothetical protein
LRVGNGRERLGYRCPSPFRLEEPCRPHNASGDEKDVPEYQAIGSIAADVYRSHRMFRHLG